MPAAVGERRKFGDQIAEWDGKGWVPIPEEPSVVGEIGERLMESASLNPLLGPAAGVVQMLRGKESPAEFALKRAGTGAAVAGMGFAGPIGRAAASPAGLGTMAGAEELIRTGSPVRAVGTGLGVAAGTKLGSNVLSSAAKEAVKHGLKRAGSLEAAAAEAVSTEASTVAGEASKSAPSALRHGAGKMADPETMRAAGDVVFSKIQTWIKAGMSEGQVSASLRELYGIEPASGKEMFRMVKQLVTK